MTNTPGRWDRCAPPQPPGVIEASRSLTAVGDPLDDLAELWRWFADGIMTGYCPLYDEIARSVAEDRELLALQYSGSPPCSPAADVAGRRSLSPVERRRHAHWPTSVPIVRPRPPAPLFRELCLGNQSVLLEVLNSRTVQTNEVGRSALLGPALTWAAAGEPLQLIDVGCSAGLNLFCDRYRLDYGEIAAAPRTPP